MRKLITTSVLGLAVLMASPMSAIAGQDTGRTSKTDVKTEVIPFQTKYIFNRDMAPGRVKLAAKGVEGKKTTTVTTFFENGKVVDKNVETKTEEPQDEVFQMGRSGFSETDRGSFTRSKVITMESTAYLPTDGSGTGRTASGIKAKYGIVAVDPKVIPIGTLVFVEGYGLALAADTGGAIKGNKIDVCLESRSKCSQWGRRKVKVHIFTDRHTVGMAKRYRS